MKFKIVKNGKKEVYLAVLIVAAGNLLGAGVSIAEKRAVQTEYLQRNKYGEGDYEENLKVRTGGKQQDIRIHVEEQKYTEKEIKEYLQQAEQELENWFEKSTDENGNVTESMDFMTQIPENPVTFSWSTGSPQILSWEGEIGENVSEKGEEVDIVCMITLEGQERTWKKTAVVFPVYMDFQQKLQKDVQTEAEKISKKSSEKLYLPPTVNGKKISYEKISQNTGRLICAGSMILGVGIIPLYKEKEQNKKEKRRKEMQLDYPDIIDKLVLFLRAGFSIRKAMERLAYSYMRNKEKYHMKEREAYEELVRTCKEMEGGVYEADAYERMGKRCALPQYKVLSVLLVQNLKKGNQNILELLEREAASAGEERKRNAKVKGEEASTKLLLPMIMQLIVVLIILMVPAFLSFM